MVDTLSTDSSLAPIRCQWRQLAPRCLRSLLAHRQSATHRVQLSSSTSLLPMTSYTTETAPTTNRWRHRRHQRHIEQLRQRGVTNQTWLLQRTDLKLKITIFKTRFHFSIQVQPTWDWRGLRTAISGPETVVIRQYILLVSGKQLYCEMTNSAHVVRTTESLNLVTWCVRMLVCSMKLLHC